MEKFASSAISRPFATLSAHFHHRPKESGAHADTVRLSFAVAVVVITSLSLLRFFLSGSSMDLYIY
jgi:hypothetical protein